MANWSDPCCRNMAPSFDLPELESTSFPNIALAAQLAVEVIQVFHLGPQRSGCWVYLCLTPTLDLDSHPGCRSSARAGQLPALHSAIIRQPVCCLDSLLCASGRPLCSCTLLLQEPGETIFVPSGWHHTVENLDDSLSINHNWLNAHNIHWGLALLKQEHAAAAAQIEDCR